MSASKERPVVSVVMSVYNDADRLARAVQSIVEQTWQDFEFIIIDDGSTDESVRSLDNYAISDPRIRLIRQGRAGLTKALIRGCGKAQGEFIARQDADDISLPDRLAQQVTLLRSDSDVGFVSCWTSYIGPRGEYLETVTRPADPRQATRQLLNERQGPPAHGSVMFRRAAYETVGGYRPEFFYAQDADLWLRMAEQVKIAYVQESLYHYRRDMNSISGSRYSLQAEFGRLGQACRQARRQGQPESPYLDEARQLAERIRTVGARQNRNDGRQTAYLIGAQLARRGDRRAAKYLWGVIKQSPCHWRAWARLAQTYMTPSPPPTTHDIE